MKSKSIIGLITILFVLTTIAAEAKKEYTSAKLVSLTMIPESRTAYFNNLNLNSTQTGIAGNQVLAPITSSIEHYYFVIKHDDLFYKSEYIKHPGLFYSRPLFIQGDNVLVRFNKNKSKLYVKKDLDGKELKSSVIEIKRSL